MFYNKLVYLIKILFMGQGHDLEFIEVAKSKNGEKN